MERRKSLYRKADRVFDRHGHVRNRFRIVRRLSPGNRLTNRIFNVLYGLDRAKVLEAYGSATALLSADGSGRPDFTDLALMLSASRLFANIPVPNAFLPLHPPIHACSRPGVFRPVFRPALEDASPCPRPVLLHAAVLDLPFNGRSHHRSVRFRSALRAAACPSFSTE
jgi:hypothetical protein